MEGLMNCEDCKDPVKISNSPRVIFTVVLDDYRCFRGRIIGEMGLDS
jgi:hypothetical protein